MRLFIAIDIEDSIKRAIQNLMNELARSCRGVRWVREDGIHITLKFLGEVQDPKVKMITTSLEKIALRFPPMNISISNLGRFPEKGRPRVLWLGVIEGAGILKRLALDIEQEMEKIGFERENRDFKPHLTIGRVKTYGKMETPIFIKKEHQMLSFGSSQVNQIFLMKSILHPDGARYEKVKGFFLKGSCKERI